MEGIERITEGYKLLAFRQSPKRYPTCYPQPILGNSVIEPPTHYQVSDWPPIFEDVTGFWAVRDIYRIDHRWDSRGSRYMR